MKLLNFLEVLFPAYYSNRFFRLWIFQPWYNIRNQALFETTMTNLILTLCHKGLNSFGLHYADSVFKWKWSYLDLNFTEIYS